MKEKLWKKITMAAVISAVLVMSAAGCYFFRPSTDLVGTWIDDFGGVRVITETTLSMYWSATDTEPAYAFDIVDYDPNSWNGGEAGEGSHGYMVLECTTPPSWNSAQEGTFTVFRWQNMMSADGVMTMEFAEGQPPAWPDGYAATAAEAAENATEAGGWYGSFTGAAKQ